MRSNGSAIGLIIKVPPWSVIFGIPTIGVAIVLSMGIGDVLVTATLMLMLGVLQIIGSILSDLLLAWLDPRVRLGNQT